jgi:endogenous inhibitor of DNA gyrase (YacG/DUF329 family)
MPSKVNWCVECGDDLPEPSRKGGKPRQFCSDKCNRAYLRAIAKKTQHIKPGVVKCPTCGHALHRIEGKG